MHKCKVCIFIYGFHNGGIEKVFENYFSHMNKNDLDLHIVSYMEPDKEREKIFRDMGFTLHKLSQFHAHAIKPCNIKEHWELFHNYQFDIVHCNMPENILPLLIARISKIKIRILHSHNDYNYIFSNINKLKKLLYKFVMSINRHNATLLIACGEVAAKTAFGSKYMNQYGNVQILRNAIDVKKYEYNLEVRKKYRNELNLNDAFVLGNVGRLENDQKNQEFLIPLLAKLKAILPNAKLLLIGEGRRRSEIEELAKKYNIEEDVIFTGSVSNVGDYLQAMDVFCFPSRYEGLGIAAIEAQTSGLPCVISDRVPKEVKITNNVSFLSINSSYDEWIDTILNYKIIKRSDKSKEICEAGYDIKLTANILRDIYFSSVKKIEHL